MITVDADLSTPPFEQIRAQIAAQVQSGELRAGQRLPAIRQLAADLRIAPGTVARAYSDLEEAGLIETSRRFGSRVKAAAAPGDSDLAEQARTLSRTAKRAGLSQADLLGLVQSAWSEISGEGGAA